VYDVLAIVVAIAVVFGLAAGILFVLDRLTLRKASSKGERQLVVAKRTARWRRRWWIFYASCAVIALVVNALNLEHEPLSRRIKWSIVPAIVVILFLLSSDKSSNPSDESED
jgi:hypothetical protein